jgi:RNA polymerase sigma-70 factor (ECF subfamily)
MATPRHSTPKEKPAEAVKRLVAEHGGQLFGLAKRFCGSADEAEDLVQEVYLQAFKHWDSFRHDASEKTWLYTIAAHACQRMHRKRAGEPEKIESLDKLLPFDDPLIAVIPSELGDQLQKQVEADARERIENAIATLPDDFRIPLILKEIVGFSVRETASILGLEEGTVRSRLHRARLKLRAAVDKAIPRTSEPASPPAYPEQTCLDLLNAKQEALDRGVPFDANIICQRCQSVFASLDLTQNICHDLARGDLPEGLRDSLLARIRSPQTQPR